MAEGDLYPVYVMERNSCQEIQVQLKLHHLATNVVCYIVVKREEEIYEAEAIEVALAILLFLDSR